MPAASWLMNLGFAGSLAEIEVGSIGGTIEVARFVGGQTATAGLMAGTTTVGGETNAE